MSKIVNARPQSCLGTFERKDVSHGPEVVLMGLVDGGTIQLRAQLGDGMIAVVHPVLNDGVAARDELSAGNRRTLFSDDVTRTQ